jgi:hypothetical protein
MMNLMAALTAGLAVMTPVTGATSTPDPELAAARAAASASDATAKEKARALPALEEENARFNRSKTLTAVQTQAIVAAKAAGHASQVAQQARQESQRRIPTVSPFQGIIEAEDLPNPFRASEFTILNYWGGDVNGKAIGVYAGYRPDDPSRGVLVVFDDPANSRGTFYDMPGAPSGITSRLGTTLVLQSRAGRQVFDLGTRQFQ